jgi:hypothetical protein
MSLIQWPFKRKEYPGLGNPRFVSDIVAANEATIDAMKAITGLGSVDFAIITGLDFTPGSPNGTYSAGVFYLNDNFYYIGAPFGEGLYLAPNPTDVMPQPFSDGNSRLTYTLLGGISTSNPTGATPLFSGDMNAYRIGLKSAKNSILAIQATIATLGNAAFRNVGTISGTVASGDDPRFGYTKTEADNKFAQIINVIQKNNTTPYTPTDAYNPATKAYADAAAGIKLLWYGNISANGATITKLGPTSGGLSITTVDHLGTGGYRVYHNVGNTNFFVNGIGRDTSAKFASPRSILNKDASTFEVWISDDASANDADFELTICQYF